MASLWSDIGNTLFGSNPSGKNPYQAPNLDFLKNPTSNPGWNTAAPAYQDYLNQVSKPSAVDASTLSDIERTTRTNLGTNLINSFSRGLYDPQSGADSDITRIGLAQTAAAGGQQYADAATALAQQRNQNLVNALSSGYQGALSSDQQALGLYTGALTGDASVAAQSANANNKNNPGILSSIAGSWASNQGNALPVYSFA